MSNVCEYTTHDGLAFARSGLVQGVAVAVSRTNGGHLDLGFRAPQYLWHASFPIQFS